MVLLAEIGAQLSTKVQLAVVDKEGDQPQVLNQMTQPGSVECSVEL